MLIAEWIDTRPRHTTVKYRLVKTGPEHYAIERCEKDLLGGDRWTKVDDIAGGHDSTPALLITALFAIASGTARATNLPKILPGVERMG